jgi:hypothetical protein
MTKFRFRLERVLRARRAAEEVQRARLFEAETLARSLDDAAQDCSEASASSCAVLRSDQSSASLDAARILVAQSAHERVLRAEHAARERAQAARIAAQGERAAWTTKRSDVRGLERLEDREREAFRDEVDVREERVIEETAARRAEIARRHEERRDAERAADRRGR